MVPVMPSLVPTQTFLRHQLEEVQRGQFDGGRGKDIRRDEGDGGGVSPPHSVNLVPIFKLTRENKLHKDLDDQIAHVRDIQQNLAREQRKLDLMLKAYQQCNLQRKLLTETKKITRGFLPYTRGWVQALASAGITQNNNNGTKPVETVTGLISKDHSMDKLRISDVNRGLVVTDRGGQTEEKSLSQKKEIALSSKDISNMEESDRGETRQRYEHDKRAVSPPSISRDRASPYRHPFVDRLPNRERKATSPKMKPMKGASAEENKKAREGETLRKPGSEYSFSDHVVLDNSVLQLEKKNTSTSVNDFDTKNCQSAVTTGYSPSLYKNLVRSMTQSRETMKVPCLSSLMQEEQKSMVHSTSSISSLDKNQPGKPSDAKSCSNINYSSSESSLQEEKIQKVHFVRDTSEPRLLKVTKNEPISMEDLVEDELLKEAYKIYNQ